MTREFDPSVPHVVAAAIKDADGVAISLPPPARHHDIIRYMVEGLNRPAPITGEQGFLMSDGAFARRGRAAMLAIVSGQIQKTITPDWLCTEDLW